MKKFINVAFIYAILAMISGVFYREFTKFMEFNGVTSLAFTHLHFFVLGTIVFLILGLFAINTNLLEVKGINKAIILYNIGLPFMVIMFYVRGIVQVLELSLSNQANAAISGIAGVSHIVLGAAIIWILLCMKKITVKK